MVNDQIGANVNQRSGAGIMGQTASDINSLSTALTRPSFAQSHPLAQIRNKILQFDLPSMSEAEKHRFMTETPEGQVLQDDIADFKYINNAVQLASTPTNPEDEGIFNAGQTELRADDLRDKLLGAIRQTQRNMYRRGITSEQFERVGEGQALREMSTAATEDAENEKRILEQQHKVYAEDVGNFIAEQGHIPSLQTFKETIAPEEMNNDEVQEAYHQYLQDNHGISNYDTYMKERKARDPELYVADQKSVDKKFKQAFKLQRQEQSNISKQGGKPIKLEGETVGQTPINLGRQGYLLEPTVIAEDDERFNKLNERLAGHYSYGMRGQEDLTAKQRIKKANNQEALTREREYDKYYKNFKPTTTQNKPLDFAEYQENYYGNNYGSYVGGLPEQVREARRRRGQVQNEISTMGDLDYGMLLKDIGHKPRMREVMNRIAPENLDYNPDDFAQVREQAIEGLASQSIRANVGRADTGIGSSLSGTRSLAPTEATSLLAPTASVKSDRIRNYASAQPLTVEESVNKKDYEDLSDTGTVVGSEATIPTENPFAQAEPLEEAQKEEKKPHGKVYTSKRGLLSGKSKYYKFSQGEGNQRLPLKFHSKEAKKRAEEIANSFKPKFIVRGRTPAIGSPAYGQRLQNENTNYTDMITQMNSEGLFHDRHIPAFLQTSQAQTEDPTVASGSTEISE
jgi:hypothetical protein